jgi:hypothetical protein
LIRYYGVTLVQKEQMLANQEFACKACQAPLATATAAQLDHCHTTHRVRGLLCRHCNTTLGKMRDDFAVFAAIIGYLARDRQVPEDRIDAMFDVMLQLGSEDAPAPVVAADDNNDDDDDDDDDDSYVDASAGAGVAEENPDDL